MRAARVGALFAVALFVASGVATGSESTTGVYKQSSESAKLESYGYDGAGTTVAIIDTGVADVPGLDGAVIHQENLSAAPAEGDQYGHGTFVAGVIHKVAPRASIVSVKLSGANGSVDASQVLAAMQWVAQNRERFSIDVVNLSFGNNSKQSWRSSPLNYGVQRLWDAGLVVVVSAGNLGNAAGTVTKPADDPLVISVGSSNDLGTAPLGDDTVPAFSSVGPTQDGLAKPDLVASGVSLVSLRAPGSTIDGQFPHARVGTDGFRGTGTSFSAPVVSGLAAQLLSAEPLLVPDEVKYALMASGRQIDGDLAAQGTGAVRGARALTLAGRANVGVGRSTGGGSLDSDRGSSRVSVLAAVTLEDGSVVQQLLDVAGDNTSQVDELGVLQTFDQAEYLSDEMWQASQWGASQWGASQWGASQWGASQWGASQWGSSDWWASQWG